MTYADLMTMTRAQLDGLARTARIAGFTAMSKTELAAALAKEYRRRQKEDEKRLAGI